MNRLVGEEASIVTSVPGTTRDVIRQQVSIQGVPIKLVDTAGLRETADVVEKEGVRRAKQEVNAADGLLLLVDLSVSSNWQRAADELLLTLPDIRKVMVVLNKTDLVDPAYRGAGELPALGCTNLSQNRSWVRPTEPNAGG